MNTTQTSFVIATVTRDGRTRYLDRFGAWTTDVEMAAKFEEEWDAEDFAGAEGVSLRTAVVHAL